MGSTKVELVKDLHAIVSKTPTGTKRNYLWRIIALAEQGAFHDFESKLAAPKMELHACLIHLGTPEALEIDKKMQSGEYDEPYERN